MKDKITSQFATPYLEWGEGTFKKGMDEKDLEFFSTQFHVTTFYEKEDGTRYIGLSTFGPGESLENHDLTKYRFARPEFAIEERFVEE